MGNTFESANASAAADHLPDELELLVGRLLDRRYLLEKFVDRGAFGVVYRGIDQKFQSSVAVKIGRSHREFMKEARLAAEVRHPNIVQVTDYGTDGGFAYLVMEFLEGDDLERLMRRPDRPITSELIKKFVCEVGDALEHAHGVNLVHRDLKPRNIFLRRGHSAVGDSSTGRFVIVDFGIAAKLDAQGTQRNRTFDGAGTVEFMAPEQLQASPDPIPQSDIYAFGVILYQLMTGRVPFPQSDGSHLALAHCLSAIANEPAPDFASAAPTLRYPVALEELVLQCLEKEPDRRPQSIAEVKERFLASYYPGMGAGDFTQTLRPSGFVDTVKVRRRETSVKPEAVRSNRSSNLIAILALLVCAVALTLVFLRDRRSETTIATEPHHLSGEVLASVNNHLIPVDENSPLKIAAGESALVTVSVSGVPAKHDVEFAALAVPSNVRVELATRTSAASCEYRVTVPEGHAMSGALPPLQFEARVADLKPIQIPLTLEVIDAAPRLVVEGSVEPPDAQLTADGVSIEVVNGQWRWTSGNAGSVVLHAERKGFESFQQEVNTAGKTHVAIALMRRLEGTIDPPSASVTVDGNALATTDGRWLLTTQKRTPLSLLASSPGYEDWKRTISGDESSPVAIKLRATLPQLLRGTLTPPDSELTINGVSVPVAEGQWSWKSSTPVRALVKASKAGYLDWSQNLTEPQEQSMEVLLKRMLRKISGTVAPRDAVVKVNGQSMTVVDGNWQWESDAVQDVIVSASKSGFSEWRKTLSSSGDLRVPIELSPIYSIEGTVDPAGATVTINGKPIVVADGQWRHEVADPGVLSIRAHMDRFADVEQSILPASLRPIALVLDPILTIVPSNATVVIGGQAVEVRNSQVRIPVAPKETVVVAVSRGEHSSSFQLTRARAEEWGHRLQLVVPPPSVSAAPLPAEFNDRQARLAQAAWASKLGVDDNWKNSIGASFVVVPPGKYTTTISRGGSEESIAVEVAKPIQMSVTEITQRQWKAVMNSEPWMSTKVSVGDDFPAVAMNWHDTVHFCDKLTEAEPGPWRYRLPSEAEWEWACRAGSTGKYACGDAEISQYGHFSQPDDEAPNLRPVGQLKANRFSLFDMHGNVDEWCADDPFPTEDHPSRAAAGKALTRGGDFTRAAKWGTSMSRFLHNKVDPSHARGFRIVREK